MLQVGDRLGEYEILATIGHGGMGTVYRARHVVTEREVALKVLLGHLSGDPQFRERFRREARMLGRIEHPSIVDIFDARDYDDAMCIAMRLLDGGTLADRLEDGPLSAREVVELLRPIAEALDAVHEEGLLHRDIKPSNILFDRHRRAVLGDFGVAKREGTIPLTRTEQIVGTVAYASPEILRGEQADARSDIYALGVVVHECLTGAHPFERDTDAEVLLAHLQEQPPALGGDGGDVDAAVEAVVLRAMAKQPGERQRTATAMFDELVAAANGASGPVVVLRRQSNGRRHIIAPE